MIMISMVLFFISSLLLLFLSSKLIKRWTDLGHLSTIPGPKRRSYLFGNLDIFQEVGKPLNYTIGQRLMGFATIYQKEGIFKFFIGTKPIVCIFSPDGFKSILGTNGQIEKPETVATLRHGLGNGLGTADGATWRKHRKLLTPTFSTKVLNGYLPIFNHHSNVLCELVQKEQLITDVEHLIVNTSLDLICETAMGRKSSGHGHDQSLFEENCNLCGDNEEHGNQRLYTESLQKFTEILVERIYSPWLQFDFIFFMTSIGEQFKLHIQKMHSFTDKIIRERISHHDSKVDTNNNYSRQIAFLDLLLHLRNRGLMTEEEIRSEVDTFAFAGHDTVAVTLTFALFEISVNPKVQEKLYQEILDVFGSPSSESHLRDVSHDDLSKLKYLECVIKEVLRLYPAGPTIGRVLTCDVKCNGHLLPSGTEVWLVIAALHMNQNVFRDPVRFIPERFMNKSYDSFSFAPFSAGIRNCIGHQFAIMEMKVLLCHIIRRFKITSLINRDKLLINFELILRLKTKIGIKFDPRFKE